MAITELPDPVLSLDYETERGKPAPDFLHSIAQTNLMMAFHVGARARYMVAPELTLEFPDGLVLTPDISVLHKRLIDWGREPEHCRDLPIVVVEVLWPAQGYASGVANLGVYLAHGVRSVWEVNLATHAVSIYHAGSDSPRVITRGEAKDLATGLTARLEDIFS